MEPRPYPDALSFYFKSLQGYSQQNIRLTTMTLPQLGPGDIIQLQLPDNAIANLDSLVLRADAVGFRGSGSNDQAIFPKQSSSFVDAVTIDIGGKVIDGSVASGYSQLAKIKTDLWEGNTVAERSILELSTDNLVAADNVGSSLARIGYTNASSTGNFGVLAGSTFTPNSDPNSSSQNAWPIVLRFKHGFLGCGKSLDLTMLTPIKLTARLSSASVVMQNANGTNTTPPSYGLYNIRAYMTTISINDGGKYYAMTRSALEGDGLAVPYKRYVAKTGAALSAGGSVLFPLITDSLDAVYVFFLLNSPSRNAPTAANSVGQYFQRKSANNSNSVTNIQLDLSGALYPQWQVPVADAWYLVRESLSKDHNLYAVDPNISLATWASTFFVFAYRWSATPGTWYRSGFNTSGLTVPAAALVNVSGDMQCTPWVIAECTSVLVIKKDRIADFIQ